MLRRKKSPFSFLHPPKKALKLIRSVRGKHPRSSSQMYEQEKHLTKPTQQKKSHSIYKTLFPTFSLTVLTCMTSICLKPMLF